MMNTPDGRTRASLLMAASDPANHEARAAFIRCYQELIRDWCRRGLQEADREDVAQAILCRLLEILPKFRYDPARRFRGYLRTMVSHQVADFHRARMSRPGEGGSGDSGVFRLLVEAPDPDDGDLDDLVEAIAGRVEQVREIQNACDRVRARVKPHNWRAFWLTRVEGVPVAEVAEELKMAKGTVHVTSYRITKMIQEEVGETSPVPSTPPVGKGGLA